MVWRDILGEPADRVGIRPRCHRWHRSGDVFDSLAALGGRFVLISSEQVGTVKRKVLWSRVVREPKPLLGWGAVSTMRSWRVSAVALALLAAACGDAEAVPEVTAAGAADTVPAVTAETTSDVRAGVEPADGGVADVLEPDDCPVGFRFTNDGVCLPDQPETPGDPPADNVPAVTADATSDMGAGVEPADGGAAGTQSDSGSTATEGGYIAFHSNPDGDYEIFVTSFDGSHVRQLTHNSHFDGDAAWSPNGAQIAFTSDRDGDWEIFVMNADATGQRQLTHNSHSDWGPVWSPDGTRIAFTSDRGNGWQIFVVSPDGTGERQLGGLNNGHPTWSPDGTRIAFQGSRGAEPEIFTMNADGTGERQLTSNAHPDGYPSWSPDGTEIAFTGVRNDRLEVFVIDVDGSNQRQLTSGTDNTPGALWSRGVSWSPDGTQVVYNRDVGVSQMFVANRDGSNPLQLTDGLAHTAVLSQGWSSHTAGLGSGLFEDVPALGKEADEASVEEEKDEVGEDGMPADGQVPVDVVYWRPGFDREALESVDPEGEGADFWERRERESHSVPEPYRHFVFYFYSGEGDMRVQRGLFDGVYRHAVSAFVGEYLWFPYRFDLRWGEYPDTVAVVATYPLGERVSVTVDADIATRGKVVLDDPPLPPPIRPTTPFTEPRWPNTAQRLGRDCPPVEEVWTGKGTEVTDRCTLRAITAAVDLMWKGSTETRQRAIRDGQALADVLQEIDKIQHPYRRALYGPVSRSHGYTYIRNVEWAGNWAGASMIHLEWNVRYTDRAFTPEETQARIELYNTLVEQGYRVHENYRSIDKYLSEDLTLGDVWFAWEPALIVRTADGTWRMSYRSFCWWHERITLNDRERLRCPADPTPHFPDSAFFDSDIYPPNHTFYYQDARSSYPKFYPHLEQGDPRLNDQYLGVPPS